MRGRNGRGFNQQPENGCCASIVSDPLGRQVIAIVGRKGETAIIEMASASGIRLFEPERLDPMKTSSFGTRGNSF
jgi:glycerate kinase